MRNVLAAFAVALLTAGTAIAATADTTAVLAPIHQFIDGLNKGDVDSALAACAEQTSIIDDFAPHEWHGAGACGKWATDFQANATANAITDEVLAMAGKPLHVAVTGDRAYVVVPASYTYKLKGKPVKESALMTLALQKVAAGWRITGWTYSKK
ncbi:MAG TPA: nuclear transport factor 2 family protein [Burkholderiaceae bacterium]|nr:nuclear transport factor 2 family protein [Burkholderiaceae bacterium]